MIRLANGTFPWYVRVPECCWRATLEQDEPDDHEMENDLSQMSDALASRKIEGPESSYITDCNVKKEIALPFPLRFLANLQEEGYHSDLSKADRKP